MNLKKFTTYQLAVEFYSVVTELKLAYHLRDQMVRAASLIALNLAEGCAKPTSKDKRKFFAIAYGSAKECQAVLDLSPHRKNAELVDQIDKISACVFKLMRYYE